MATLPNRSRNFSRTEFFQNKFLFPSSSSIFRVPCRSEFNFCSTVSVNKFDAVIELELQFRFLFTFYAVLLFSEHSSNAIDWRTLFFCCCENVICRLSFFAPSFRDFLFDSLSKKLPEVFSFLRRWKPCTLDGYLEMDKWSRKKRCGQRRE